MDLRLAALRRFSLALTVVNIAGRAVLGFESSWSQLFWCIGIAYGLESAIEVLDAWAERRRPTLLEGSLRDRLDFMLPAHITGLAVSMLLYTNDRYASLAFAVCVGIGSKRLFRIDVNGRRRHFLNPSNTGIAVTLLAFPSVGIAPPYQFVENVHGAWDAVLPLIFLGPACLMTAKLTKRVPMVTAWVVAFAAQALVRAWFDAAEPLAALVPMTGVAFILFSFYMLPDPGTTPVSTRGQIAFGASVAIVYGVLIALHVVFTLFFALVIVCACRGVGIVALNAISARRPAPQPVAVWREPIDAALEAKLVSHRPSTFR